MIVCERRANHSCSQSECVSAEQIILALNQLSNIHTYYTRSAHTHILSTDEVLPTSVRMACVPPVCAIVQILVDLGQDPDPDVKYLAEAGLA